MTSTVRSVLDKSDELLRLLAILTPTESESQVVRNSLARLQDFEVTKKRKTNGTSLQILGVDQLQRELSSSSRKILLAIIKSLADQSRKPTHDYPLFSSFVPSSRTKPALRILDSYFAHSARGATERKILALLVSHAIDCEIIGEEAPTANKVIAEWSETLGQTFEMVKNVERLGRCCLGILDGRDEHGQACFDPTGFGLLAMMPSHTGSLKDLASQGCTLLQACKSVKGFEAEASRLAPAVRSSISTIAIQCKLSIADRSRLGHVLAFYDSRQSTLPQENANGYDRLPSANSPCRPTDSLEPESCNDNLNPSSSEDDLLVRGSTRDSATLGNSEQPTITLYANGQEQSKDILLRNLLSLLQGFQLDSITEAALLRGVNYQYRWNCEGERVVITLHDTSIRAHYARLFDDQALLMSLLDIAVEKHALIRENGKIRSNHASQIEDRLSLDSLAFLCYICPRDEILEPNFQKVMRDLLPHFQKYFQDIREPIIPEDSQLLLDVGEVYVATSCASNLDCFEAIRVIERYLAQPSIPDSLRLGLTDKQSVFLRRQGNYSASDHLVYKALKQPFRPNVRTTCLVGDLRLSLAENAVLRNEYTYAESLVDAIEVANIPHLLVARLRERKWTTKARIYRFTGRFELAKWPLRSCLGVRKESSRVNQCHIVRPLADIYVELGEYNCAKQLLENCLLNMRGDQKTHTRAYNRLLLSKADLEIAEFRYDNAKSILSQVAGAFKSRPPISQTDQLDHVRTAIASLRIMMRRSTWAEVLKPSTQAIRLTESYSSFTPTNYYKGYLILLRAVSQLHLVEADLKAAAVCVQEPRHFMTGVGTFDREMAHMSLNVAIRNCVAAADDLLMRWHRDSQP